MIVITTIIIEAVVAPIDNNIVALFIVHPVAVASLVAFALAQCSVVMICNLCTSFAALLLCAVRCRNSSGTASGTGLDLKRSFLKNYQ